MRHPTAQVSIGLGVWLAIGLFIASTTVVPTGPAQSREPNKTLRLYFGHTGERSEFTFKRNGQYDRAELERINRFLRDWRRNEPTRMDPKLLDLVWAIYRESGSHEYIHVVSAYRSLATNNMLRSRSRGVAEHSQHTLGKAMDFYLPDVPLPKLRAIAMRFQVGGVGFYPTSGSPFVHVDTGSPRYWPRMSRQQLIAMFPDGKTVYLPADGKPLAGYELALAERRSSGGTALAYLETNSRNSGGENAGGGWLKRMFSGGADEGDDTETAAVSTPARKPAPAQPPVPSVPAVPAAPAATGGPQVLIASVDEDTNARLPRARPGAPGEEVQLASLRADLPDSSEPAAGVAGEATAAVAAPSTDGAVVAALGFAPVPKKRPDPTLLIDSLARADGSHSLDVAAEDAIGALAGHQPAGAGAFVQVASVGPAEEPAAPSDADRALLAGFSALEGAPTQSAEATSALAAAAALSRAGHAPPVPRPRPMMMAFAAAGLPPAEATPQLRPAAAPATGVPTVAAHAAKAIASLPPPAYAANAAALGRLIADPTVEAARFTGFAMPQPAGAPGLFTAPGSAAEVTDPADDPKLPTGRFQVAEAEESFFSRLFASLAE